MAKLESSINGKKNINGGGENTEVVQEGKKSWCFSYILLIVGGQFGLHLIYLRRYRHALFMWVTCGFLGLETLRHFIKIGDYVEESNLSYAYVDKLKAIQRHRSAPKYSILRFSAEIIFGYFLQVLFFSIFPIEIYELNYQYYSLIRALVGWIFVPFGIASGVFLIGNIGMERIAYKYCLIGAYIGSVFFLLDFSSAYPTLFCTVVANWKGKSWKPIKHEKPHFLKAMTIMSVLWSIYIIFIIIAVYQNAKVETKDGEKIMLKDAVHNFFTSPAWKETKKMLGELWNVCQEHGWEKMWKMLQIQLDPEGEANAYDILELDDNATEKEISTAYRKLAKKWHPDKHHNPQSKNSAAAKFMEIQKAYDTLSKIRRRQKYNKSDI